MVPRGAGVDQGDAAAIRKMGLEPREGLRVYTASGGEVDLRNWYRGKGVFLVCNGPSLAQEDLELLRAPGVVTAGVNNGYAVWRPDLWFCVDDPQNFMDVIWKDPGVTKFAPLGKLGKHLKVKKRDGSFKPSVYRADQMPATYFFPRNEKFSRHTYLLENSVNWGCSKGVECSEGVKSQRSVMLAAFRLLIWMGFRKVWLVGADFNMEEGRGYAFEQARNSNSVKNNNRTFKALSKRFASLEEQLKRMKVRVRNCTQGSGLEVWPYQSLVGAVAEASRECSKQVDTEGWYDNKVQDRK